MSKITPDNLDKWLFNLQEGNLTSAEKKALDQFLNSHPEYKEDAELWGSAQFSESLSPITFESELHAIAGQSFFADYRKWAVAATLLLLLGSTTLYFVLNSNDSENNSTELKSQNSENGNNSTFLTAITNLNSSEKANNNSSVNKNVNHSDLNSVEENNSENTVNSETLTNGNQSNSNTGNALLNNKSNSINTSKDLYTSNSNSKKSRDKVIIDIKNDVNIIHENEIETVNNFANNNSIAEEENSVIVTDGPDERVKLTIKENSYTKRISENKGNTNNRRKNDRYKLDPNPSFTNLRDPQLLMTENNLVNQYNGFTGGMIASRFSVNYRNNWTGRDGIQSQNAVFSYDKLMRKIKTGIGFTAFYNDYNKGSFTTLGAALTVAPKFKLGRGTSIEPAVTFSYAQKNRTNDLEPGTEIEDRRGNVVSLYQNGNIPAATSAYLPNMKIGAVFQHKKFWAAASFDNLLMPKEKLYADNNSIKNGIEFKTTIGTDYLHRPESGNVVSPQMTFYYHNGYTEMWLGSIARFKQFSVGGSFSQYKDFLATAGYQTHSFKVFYQFDMTRSVLMNEKIASHEIGMRFSLNGNNRGSKSILNNPR